MCVCARARACASIYKPSTAQPHLSPDSFSVCTRRPQLLPSSMLLAIGVSMCSVVQSVSALKNEPLRLHLPPALANTLDSLAGFQVSPYEETCQLIAHSQTGLVQHAARIHDEWP